MGKRRTIVCGVDGSPGGRTAARVAVLLARQFDARLIVVHVLDRLMTASETAERVAASILFEEAPDCGAEVRGEMGDVAERLAAVASSEEATMIILGAASRGRSRFLFRASCAAELADLTNVPVLVVPTQQVAGEPAAGELAVAGEDR
jgi:nucleotide-binding universal stress UspA family protein